MATPNRTTATASKPAVTAEVSVEVGAAPEGGAATVAQAVVRKFVTTTEDAPKIPPPNAVRLSARTLAEQAAGKQAIAAYTPVGE